MIITRTEINTTTHDTSIIIYNIAKTTSSIMYTSLRLHIKYKKEY